MDNLNGIKLNDNLKLKKVTLAGEELRKVNDNYSYKQFYIELNSDTDYHFRLIFKVHRFLEQKRVDLSVKGQQKFLDWNDLNGVTGVSLYTVCKWILSDYNVIEDSLIHEIKREFPTFKLRNELPNFFVK